MRRTFPILGILWLLTGTLMAQVTISPTSLFIDSKQRYATLLVLNGTDDPQEISVSYEFGYPVSDENGHVTMRYDDAATAESYSIAGWIRGFPKRFVLDPGKRQVVRLTVKPPRDLNDGVYWARVRTVSESLAPEVGAPNPDGITALIQFKFEQVTSVFYRTGDVSTGLAIRDAWTEEEEDKLAVIADLEKQGNAPYLGTMRVSLQDQAGNILQENMKFISVYFDGRQRLEMNTSDLKRGEYIVHVDFTGTRADIPDKELPASEPVTTVVGFVKP